MYTVGYGEANAMNEAISHVTQGSATIPCSIGKGYTLYERMEGKKAHCRRGLSPIRGYIDGGGEQVEEG